ncbi:ectoine hydroxylase [Flexivirga endophytica]|uniref:Ectoine hydroxylase n=1 Tax=Flexivirga endophytica TaxID=1849103 RepID=A0A916WVG8_9MICO|nr:ectoine hydroxylase [Flexivirga endophytica]GGB33239.1 ectoine hydroxylase [Flexivirga endophytica]GHB41236.1 ectoine hydroxylase [Flexivirga endophytica]
MTTTRTTDHYPTRHHVEAEAAPTPRTHPTVWGTDADGPFDEAALDEHERHGFTILQDFITPTEVETFTAELNRLASDPTLRGDERVITEKTSGEVRSVFQVEQLSEQIDALTRDPRLLHRARQLLGSDVYLHQTRVNYMPGFKGTGFYWHSDFETWHAEDGLPAPRAVSCSIALTPNYPFNGGLMVMPGSHQTFVPGIGETPDNNHAESLKEQTVGVPDEESIADLAHRCGVDQFTGPAGSALWFDSNIMHASANNITPYPRSNIFLVFNSVANTPVEPYAARTPRPAHIAARDFTPLH